MLASASTRTWLVHLTLVVAGFAACGKGDDGMPSGGANAAGNGSGGVASEEGAADAGEGGAGRNPDQNHDNVADDLGKVVDRDQDALADRIDINDDGKLDGIGIDTDGDGVADALALDPDCDGFYETYDTDGDGQPDVLSRLKPLGDTTNCQLPDISGPGSGGAGATGGSSTGSDVAAGRGGAGDAGSSELGQGVYQGMGRSSDPLAEWDVYRDGVGYKFIANGWGMGWRSHTISWNGTSFTIESFNGEQASDGSPAGSPTMFCGLYSNKQSIDECGLPSAIASLKSVKTGWRWKPNGNNGQYSAAWDIWLGNGANPGSFSAYLMVWLRDPPGQQPMGAPTAAGVKVTGLPGSWNVWTGTVDGHPIVSYVRAEGQDLLELEFDVLDVYQDAQFRNLNLPGSYIHSVAIGYQLWNGPITNLVTEDFYVDAQ